MINKCKGHWNKCSGKKQKTDVKTLKITVYPHRDVSSGQIDGSEIRQAFINWNKIFVIETSLAWQNKEEKQLEITNICQKNSMMMQTPLILMGKNYYKKENFFALRAGSSCQRLDHQSRQTDHGWGRGLCGWPQGLVNIGIDWWKTEE